MRGLPEGHPDECNCGAPYCEDDEPVLVLHINGEVHVFKNVDEMAAWLIPEWDQDKDLRLLPVGQFFPMAKDDAKYLYPSAFGD